jgi:RNA polymerase sigma-70 factor (ECF subfamily)
VTGQEKGVGQHLALAGLVAGSDEEHFHQLFQTSYRPLVAYARRRSASWGDADDLVAEVYATAWRRRQELDQARPALPWLYGIAGNALRNQLRSSRRRLELVDRLQAQAGPVSGATGDPAERPGSELREAIAGLSFEDQEVLRLVAWEGLSHAEVGEALDCTPNAVAIRVHRARQRLADALHPSNPDDPEDKS